jgi:nicotinamidase-related amidase
MYRVEHIEPNKTAMIVVDMQNDFVAPGAPMEVPAGRAMVPTLQRALACCREHGIPVIYTAHVHRLGGCDLGRFADADNARSDVLLREGQALAEGTPGVAIFPEIAPHDGEIVIPKHRYSAFYGTDLEIVLRGLGVTTVVISGVSTDNCCHATARDALFRDFRVVVLADATASGDSPDLGWGAMTAEEVHRACLIILAASTGDVISTETFIDRVTASADVEQRLAPNLTNGSTRAARQAALVP